MRYKPGMPDVITVDSVIALGPCWSDTQVRAAFGEPTVPVTAVVAAAKRGQIQWSDARWVLARLLPARMLYVAAIEVGAVSVWLGLGRHESLADARGLRDDLAALSTNMMSEIRRVALRVSATPFGCLHGVAPDRHDAVEEILCRAYCSMSRDAARALGRWAAARLELWHRAPDLLSAHRAGWFDPSVPLVPCIPGWSPEWDSGLVRFLPDERTPPWSRPLADARGAVL